MDAEYKERIMLSGGVPVSRTELLMLIHFFSIWLNVKNSADVTRIFYDLITRSLANDVNISEDCDIVCISEKIGLADMSGSDDVFVIWNFPDMVFKITWGMLKNQWDDVWQSPQDDALILYVPNKKVILVTYWDVVYYS